MSENSNFELNQRIQVGDDRGTILYIGQVNRIKGEVLGIEWDNVERGKHSGNFEGVQYFTTIKPNSGSFLKLSTLIHSQTIPTPNTKEYSLGTDLFDSIILKYATFDIQQEVKLNNSTRVVEAIGFEESFNRQKHVENLKVISLLGYCISKSENNEKLKTLTSLEDLNLSSNLLNSWSTISEITSQLINLTALNLSDNLFTPLTEPLINENFQNLNTLYLNKTKISWDQLGLLESSLPNLTQLDLKDNGLNSIEFKPFSPDQKTWFNNLLELNLHFNNFTDNNSLSELIKFPKLRKLALSFNQLNYFTDPNNPKLISETLEELHIDENPLSDWLAISQLVVSFPNLTALKLFPNTLINDEFAIGRANTLGKLLNLTRLNGSDVTKEERVDWERYYLSKIISVDLGKLSQSDFNKLHPTYNELVKKHGEVQVQKPQVDDSKLKNRLKKLNFHQVENSTNLTPIKTISKSVLSNLNILQLQTLILKLFKLKINSSQLTIFPLSNPELVFELKSRNLEFYGIEDGQDLGFYY